MKINVPSTPPEARNAKLQEAILYIASKGQNMPYFGTTKLYKLLFLADRNAFRERGETVTGDGYIKRKFGPVPKQAFSELSRMDAEGRLSLDTQDGMYSGGKYESVVPIPSGQVSLKALSEEDVKYLDHAIAMYGSHTAKKLSKLTHEMPAWRWAKLNESMDLDLLNSDIHVDLSPMSALERQQMADIYRRVFVSNADAAGCPV